MHLVDHKQRDIVKEMLLVAEQGIALLGRGDNDLEF